MGKSEISSKLKQALMVTVDGKLQQQSSGILLYKYRSQQRMSNKANLRAS